MQMYFEGTVEGLRKTIGVQLEDSKKIYFQRMRGETRLWSASTRCLMCGKWWLWGVRDNLNFICPEHGVAHGKDAARTD